MEKQDTLLKVVGRVETVDLPELSVAGVSARVDTGAKTSSIWATNVRINERGQLSFILFGASSPWYTGDTITTESYETTVVASSNGIAQRRYKVKVLVRIKNKKLRASFTLADRSSQVYPILVGRNILRGKFIVDVKKGKVLKEKERQRTLELQKEINKDRKIS